LSQETKPSTPETKKSKIVYVITKQKSNPRLVPHNQAAKEFPDDMKIVDDFFGNC